MEMLEEKRMADHGIFCDYCDRTGIVFNDHFRVTGDLPFSPCPRCVMHKCKCGGKAPYYYFENDEITDCFCRDIRLRIEKINRIYTRSGIDRKYQWKLLGDFKSRDKLSDEARKIAYDIVHRFPDVKKGLFLWGNPGTGKTLLATIILTELIRHNAIEGRFIKISRTFFNRLKATFVEGSESYGESSKIEKELSEVDVLVVDDFGVQRDSPWEQETLYNLVDARYEAEKFTIFTSNNDPAKAFRDLSQGRILSRIREMCMIIELSGDDFRETL